MSPEEALAVLRDFAILSPDNYKNQFAQRKQATGVYASSKRDDLRPVIGGDINKFRQLLTFLDSDATGPATRGDVLIALNSVFNLGLYMLANTSAFLIENQLRTQLLDLKQHGTALIWGQIQTFTTLRTTKGGPKNAQDAAVEVTKTFYGKPMADVMEVLRAVVADQGNAVRVSNGTIDLFIQISKGCPMKKFPGFAAWGPGDSGADGETNRKNHFVKHVLGKSGTDLEEAPWWWQALEIKPRKTDLTGAVTATEDACFKPDGSLNPAKIKDFIGSAVKDRADLREAIYNAYKDHYSEYAFKLSRELSNTMVESEVGLVGISGFNGHVFLFGRYDGPGTALGLSSCYFVFEHNRADKLNPNKPSKMWKLT